MLLTEERAKSLPGGYFYGGLYTYSSGDLFWGGYLYI